MPKRVFSRTRSPRKRTSEFSTVSDGGMFASRPFVVQSKVREEGEKSGLKTSLNRAENYGHHLSQLKSIEATKGVVQRASDIEEEESSSPLSSPPSLSDKEAPKAPEGSASAGEREGAKEERPMDAMSRLTRAHERGLARRGEPGEIGSRQPVESATGGIARVSRGGRGGKQAMVTTNKKDHPGTTNPGMSYSKVSSSLGQQGFDALGRAYNAPRGEEVGSLSPQTRRNTTMMDGLIHTAEPHRDAGAGKLGRAAVRRVQEGELPPNKFSEAFPMAKPRGSQSLKRARDGKKPLSKTALETAEQMSTSSNTSSDEEKKRRRGE